MADRVIKTGDTYPPLLVTLTVRCDATDPARYPDPSDPSKWVKRVNVTTADQLRVIMKTGTTIVAGIAQDVETVDGAGTTGAVSGQEPGLGVPANRGQVRYLWAAGDTDIAGEYAGETEVTWDSAATPPQVETFPNDASKNWTVSMVADLD